MSGEENDDVPLNDEFFNKLQMKIFVIGDSGVGKSCLMLRYVTDTFEQSFLSTIGMDYKCKTVELHCEKTGKKENVNLQIWDTAGQERFLSITVSQYREAHGILLCYDLTEESTFQHVTRWLKNIRENTDKEVAILLCGNKCDLQHKRSVERSTGELLASEHQMKFVECSAKNGEGVKKAFNTLAVDAMNLAIADQVEKIKVQHIERVRIREREKHHHHGRDPQNKCCLKN